MAVWKNVKVHWRKVAAAGVALAGTASYLLWLVGSKLTAPHPHSIGPGPQDLPIEPVQFPSASGSQIHGWLIPAPANKGVVILLHGVHGNRRSMIGRARFLHRAGYAVLLFDFQAHGESPGKLVTFGYLESRDVAAAVDFVGENYPGRNVGLIGFSMGGAAALLAKPELRVKAMVLEAVYPRIRQAVEDRLIYKFGFPAKWGAPLLTWQLRPRLGIGTDGLRPIENARQITIPKLFLAGTADRLTPLEESEELFHAAAKPKFFWKVKGAGHQDLHAFAGREYEKRVLRFLEANLEPGLANRSGRQKENGAKAGPPPFSVNSEQPTRGAAGRGK